MKRRENNYDVATVTMADTYFNRYSDYIAKFDLIAIYMKNNDQTTYAQVFGGIIRDVNPTHPQSKLTLLCKGYGALLEETHCNRDYGAESSNPTLNEADEILTDVVDNFVEKSFADAATEWAMATTRVSDFCSTSIKYINNPYRANIEVADTVCMLTSAIGAGTAGAHWIVVPDAALTSMFLLAKIGDHAAGTNSPESEWPDWWAGTEAASTLTQGVDFTDWAVLDKTEEYANHIVLVTDFRRPAYDYWAESGAALWGNDAFTSITDDSNAGYFVVGANSLLFTPNGAVSGYGYYPSTADASWDVTKWGSTKTIPRLNFYMRKKSLTALTTYVMMSDNSTARKTDYFYCPFTTWNGENDDTWYSKSIPIGPYWMSAEESKDFKWQSVGSPSWSNIDSVEFHMSGAGAGGTLHIDDLHFNGKITRSAKDTSEITAHGEYQKVLIARNAMDDSCVAADDSGFAGRVAYAELLRRATPPQTITFTIPAHPTCSTYLMMAGQKTHVHAGKRADGTYRIDATMRMLTVEHNWSIQGATTTVTATTDLTNSFPINAADQYAMWQENMFLLSSEAKSIRAGAEVDLLIPRLEKSY